MALPETRLKVFFCHSSNDKAAVRDLYDRFRHVSGIDAWLDEKNLLPGSDWDLEIRKAVRLSHVVLVCLSENSVSKEGYVQKELKHALGLADEKPEGTIFLIPLRLNRCEVPDRLRRWHWVDLFEDGGFQRLLSALHSRASQIGIAISQVAGTLIYDSRTESPPFRSWTLYSTAGGFAHRFRVDLRDKDNLATFEFSSAADECVGINRSLRPLHGFVQFDYKILSGAQPALNVYFAMIPMQETGAGRAGLVEVGTEVEDDPRNAFSTFRVRLFAPTDHYGDGLWHRAQIEFDFRPLSTAFYSIFGPRINEGCETPAPGRVLISDVQAYSLE
jgi:hypothetical protein